MAFTHEDVVDVFLKTLLQKHPELRHELPANMDALKETMTAMLKLMKPDINQNDLRDPDSLKQLTIALVTSLSIHKLSLDPNKNYLQKINLIFASKKIGDKSLLELLTDPHLNPTLAPALLEKHLTPEDKKMIQSLIQKACEEILNDLQRTNLIEFNPGIEPASVSKEISEKTEAFINLFGLLGNIPIPVPVFKGNFLGIPDLNPYPGAAQIDLLNRTDDPAGDSLGLNAITKSNYAQMSGNAYANIYKEELKPEGSALISAFEDLLREERLISSPSLMPPGGLPPK